MTNRKRHRAAKRKSTKKRATSRRPKPAIGPALTPVVEATGFRVSVDVLVPTKVTPIALVLRLRDVLFANEIETSDIVAQPLDEKSTALVELMADVERLREQIEALTP